MRHRVGAVRLLSAGLLAASSFVIAPGAAANAAGTAVAASTPKYANCTAMQRTYPHGVGRPGARDHVRGSTKPVTNFKVSKPLYDANSRLDGDKDGVACERR
jgi:hypothetical protein